MDEVDRLVREIVLECAHTTEPVDRVRELVEDAIEARITELMREHKTRSKRV